MTTDTKPLALKVVGQSLCPFCGAYSPRQCELLEETGGFCPWEDGEPDPDILRDDAHERERLRKEFDDAK
jgi:hypothetical protein